MNKKYHIPCMIMRGGTSKGVFFMENDLPADKEERDRILLKIMGSPDAKQLNGLGGAASVTSKAAIVSVSQREDADVDYTFAQISVDKPIVSYKGNCGNILSAVGPFAIERGLVKVKEPLTTVRIYNTNTGKIMESEVTVENGSVKYDGDYSIAGVTGSGAPIRLSFLNPAGTLSKGLLPTGNVTDELEVSGLSRKVMVSIVDAANPLVFVKAEDLGVDLLASPKTWDCDEAMLTMLEAVRGAAAVKLGLIDDCHVSAWMSPGIPKLAIVGPARDYATTGNEIIKSGQIDFLSRMMSMQKTHPSYAMTGAMCTAAAAVAEGSVVWQIMRKNADRQQIRIGHPAGILDAGVNYSKENGEIRIQNTFGFRTANLLMEGNVYCC